MQNRIWTFHQEFDTRKGRKNADEELEELLSDYKIIGCYGGYIPYGHYDNIDDTGWTVRDFVLEKKDGPAQTED